jgi:hypothetical protein
MPFYDIPLVLTIAADSYESAMSEADDFIEGNTDDGIGLCVAGHETDNAGQRVVYLHPTNSHSEWVCDD